MTRPLRGARVIRFGVDAEDARPRSQALEELTALGEGGIEDIDLETRPPHTPVGACEGSPGSRRVHLADVARAAPVLQS
jgi:hypothetical protein